MDHPAKFGGSVSVSGNSRDRPLEAKQLTLRVSAKVVVPL